MFEGRVPIMVGKRLILKKYKRTTSMKIEMKICNLLSNTKLKSNKTNKDRFLYHLKNYLKFEKSTKKQTKFTPANYNKIKWNQMHCFYLLGTSFSSFSWNKFCSAFSSKTPHSQTVQLEPGGWNFRRRLRFDTVACPTVISIAWILRVIRENAETKISETGEPTPAFWSSQPMPKHLI